MKSSEWFKPNNVMLKVKVVLKRLFLKTEILTILYGHNTQCLRKYHSDQLYKYQLTICGFSNNFISLIDERLFLLPGMLLLYYTVSNKLQIFLKLWYVKILYHLLTFPCRWPFQNNSKHKKCLHRKHSYWFAQGEYT